MAAPVLAQDNPLPLQKGLKWIYEGTIKWEPAEHQGSEGTNVQWTMSVISVQSNKNVTVALISGILNELAWYDEDRNPSLSILVGMTNKVYSLCSMCEKTPQKTTAAILKDPSKAISDHSNLLLDLPLRNEKSWGGDTERDDHWYCWHVLGEKMQTLEVRGVDPNRKFQVYSVAYRTGPDHQIIEYAEGLGIIKYVYVHHGTISEADMRLVEFKRE